jgi:hypothetical protein
MQGLSIMAINAPLDLSTMSLAEIAQAVAENRLPPVEHWNPDHCGHSDMRIAADGTWFHQGSPIGRIAMVKLFSTILRREPDGGYVLVTPVEKLDIDVEDAPFIAVEVNAEGAGQGRRLAFRTNVDDVVFAGPDHPLRFEQRDDGPRPYVMIRRGLEARIARPVYYELANMAIEDDAVPPGLWSDGVFFPLEPSA